MKGKLIFATETLPPPKDFAVVLLLLDGGKYGKVAVAGGTALPLGGVELMLPKI